MRIVPFISSTLITLVLILLLHHKWGAVPPLGKFLSPQQGFWQNAEPVDYNFNETLTFKGLKGKVNVYMDERLVPHIFSSNDEDVYFVQGYLHAKFRLWQMEFQTMAAAGRISEILGSDPRFIRYDKEQRRLGMVYGAENAAKAMETDSLSKVTCNAYTAGINAYISSLTESNLPIEYKLLDYKPEQWSNLKIGLFLMLMSKDLAGYERDLEFTNTKSVFSHQELMLLYPQLSDSSVPVIPKGTVFNPPAMHPVIPSTADSLYFGKDTTLSVREVNKPARLNGSNNWAVNGSRTRSKAPILCNDPHLGLSLPSIWYEMQMSTPTMNVYGASFPGSPSVIIGFNDSIAFGFTNAMRDVKDYYKITFKDATKKEYQYNGQWHPSDMRIEDIKVRGAASIKDTVAYTVFGPVMYDESFMQDSMTNNAIAVQWTAHTSSNEGALWLKLDRAKNYVDYLKAIHGYNCPGQNMLFASKSGDIAIWQQGKFPARWKGQGLYIMPGEDSGYAWQGYIPRSENPHLINPASGYIESANQRPVDSAYPYFIPGNYFVSRGMALHKRLEGMQDITPQDMMKLQNDVHDEFAAAAMPLLLKYASDSTLTETGKRYLDIVKQWNYNITADSRAATIFKVWWDSLYAFVWKDDFSRVKGAVTLPDNETLLENLLKDPSFKYIDDITTPQIETLQQAVTQSLQKATFALQEEEERNGLIWYKYKSTAIYHLLKTAVLPFARTDLPTGGWRTTINAITHDHGPSWRMIVQLSDPTEAYGIYPGGQSGNAGSKYYDNFVDNWVAGKYYTLWMMKEEEQHDKRVKWKLTFTNA